MLGETSPSGFFFILPRFPFFSSQNLVWTLQEGPYLHIPWGILFNLLLVFFSFFPRQSIRHLCKTANDSGISVVVLDFFFLFHTLFFSPLQVLVDNPGGFWSIFHPFGSFPRHRCVATPAIIWGVAVYCCVLQCVAVCGSVLLFVAAWCSVLQLGVCCLENRVMSQTMSHVTRTVSHGTR